MPSTDEERERYNRLIEVLENSVEKAANVLGPHSGDSLRESRIKIRSAHDIYEYLCDLLDEALAARSRLG